MVVEVLSNIRGTGRELGVVETSSLQVSLQCLGAPYVRSGDLRTRISDVAHDAECRSLRPGIIKGHKCKL